MKKHIPVSEEDPQMYPPDPCADSEQTQKKHKKSAVEGGLIFRADIPKNFPPEIPLK